MNPTHPAPTNPIREFCDYLAGWTMLARAKGRFAELLGIEAAQDIAVDAVAHERSIAASAHKAETYSREAVRLMDEAQKPDSPGGENITPAEAQGIRAFETKSAEIDHDISDAAAV